MPLRKPGYALLVCLAVLPSCAARQQNLAALILSQEAAPSDEEFTPPESNSAPSTTADGPRSVILIAGESEPETEGPIVLDPESSSALTAQQEIQEPNPPPLETTDVPYQINLATALRLSDARPLIVAAAQASAWVAEAQLQRAQVLWVPEVNLGVVYIRHDGFGPDFNRGVNHPAFGFPGGGGPLNQNINYLYAGGSVYQVVNVTDAIFEPLAARQVLNSRRWNIQAAKNDALLATARAYFSVHQYRGQYAATLDVVERGRKLVERITALSEDLVPRIEVERAKSQLARLEQKAAVAREEWRVASADLTEVLRLDPRVVVEPAEPDHLQITLIEPERSLDELIAIGVATRPEIGEQKAMIQAAEVRIRRETHRPLLPMVLLTGFQTPGHMRMQAGYFGTGYDRNLNLWSWRNDVSLQLVWQLEGLGFGNMARIKQERGEESRAVVGLYRQQDSIAAEVTEAQARLQSAAVRVVQAERALRESQITFEGNFEGLRQTKRFGNVLVQIYRPQEAVIALDQLAQAYDAYFKTVADYNRSQFELFHALGYPASEITAVHPPGEIVPVDTERPAYLPPVGEGPPAATR
ncbi:MAG: TolC family protein [Planctomycetaceae bacterium]